MEKKLEEQRYETERLFGEQARERERIERERDSERYFKDIEDRRNLAEKEAEEEREREYDRLQAKIDRDIEKEERQRIAREAVEEQERIMKETIKEQEKIKKETIEEQKRIAANAWKYEADSKRNEAIRLIKGKMPDLAVKLLSDAVTKDPSNMWNHLWLSGAYCHLHDTDNALKYCRSGVNLFAMDTPSLTNPNNHIWVINLLSMLDNPAELMDSFSRLLNNSSSTLDYKMSKEIRTLYFWAFDYGYLQLARVLAVSALGAMEDNDINIALNAINDILNKYVGEQEDEAKTKTLNAMRDGGLLDTITDVLQDLVVGQMQSFTKFGLMAKLLEVCDIINKPYPEDIIRKGLDGIDFNSIFRNLSSIERSPNLTKPVLRILQLRLIRAFEEQYERYLSHLNCAERISAFAGYFQLCGVLEHVCVDKIFSFDFKEGRKDDRVSLFRAIQDLEAKGGYSETTINILQKRCIQEFEEQYENFISGLNEEGRILNERDRISVYVDYIKTCKLLKHSYLNKIFDFGSGGISERGRESLISHCQSLRDRGLLSENELADVIKNIKAIKAQLPIFRDDSAPRVLDSKSVWAYKIDKDNVFYDLYSRMPVMRLEKNGLIYPVRPNVHAEISGEAVWKVNDSGEILTIADSKVEYYLKDLKEENYTCDALRTWGEKLRTSTMASQTISSEEHTYKKATRKSRSSFAEEHRLILTVIIGLFIFFIIGVYGASKTKTSKNQQNVNKSSIAKTTATVDSVTPRVPSPRPSSSANPNELTNRSSEVNAEPDKQASPSQIAAEQGDSLAQARLGFMYERGDGVKQDYEEAIKWYRKAAEQGHSGSQNNLGNIYELGKGVPKDYAEAVRWYRKAAEQGEALAQSNLGRMYAMGHGVRKDYVQAYMWFDLAATGYPETEGEKREKAIKMRNAAASRITRSQVNKAEQLVREWKPNKER
jgi:flagellar biosynthesis GTPase FlhF